MRMKTILSFVVAVSLCVVSGRATALQGTPAFSATPSSVDMGPVAVGVPTPFFGVPPPFFQPLQISNSGTAPLTATFSFSSSEFGFDPVTHFVTPVTVAAASSVTGGLQFKPFALGTRTGQFISTDNAPGSPHTVQLTGTGMSVPNNDFAVVLDPGAPTTITVPRGQTATFTIWALAGLGLNTPVSAFAPVQCAGGPAGTMCTTNPSGFFALNASVNPRQKIVVSVTPPASAALLPRGLPVLWGLVCLSGIVLVFRQRVRWSIAALAAAIVVCGSMIACGGSSGGGNTTPITITVGQQVGSAAVSHTLTVPMNVQ
jgi:large repetitive protein